MLPKIFHLWFKLFSFFVVINFFRAFCRAYVV